MTFEQAVRKSIAAFYEGKRFEATEESTQEISEDGEETTLTPFLYDQEYFDELEESIDLGDIEIPEADDDEDLDDGE